MEHLAAVVAASVIGFAGNEAVALFRIKVGREIGSAALVADGYHARVDALTSLSVLLAAAGVWLGYPLADPLVGLGITIVILAIVWPAARTVVSRMREPLALLTSRPPKHPWSSRSTVENPARDAAELAVAAIDRPRCFGAFGVALVVPQPGTVTVARPGLSEPSPVVQPASRSAGKVLVVDDREENRLMLRQLFERIEYQVIEAAGGGAGVSLALNDHPDCILLDLEMPGMSGFEVLERLRCEDRTAEIPIIILTGVDDNIRNLERALRGGAVDYLTKPISPLRVAVRVRSVIERRELLRELRTHQSSLGILLADVSQSVLAIKAAVASLVAATAAPTSDAASRYLQEVRVTCDALLPRLQQTMQDCSVEMKGPGPELRILDVGALVDAMVQRLGPLAERNGMSLNVSRLPAAGASAARAAATAVAEPRSLEHVLSSLLVRAFAFASAGSEIRVELASGNDRVEVRVTYPGAEGPPAELAVCRHLIEAQRGQLVTATAPNGCVRTVLLLSSTVEP